jgi:hypothetical protein
VDPGSGAGTQIQIRPGVDVMIAIFCDFCLIFGEKKLAMFSKTNVMVTFLQKLVVV